MSPILFKKTKKKETEEDYSGVRER